MLTLNDDAEIAALAAQGWSISAIARHVGHDRKTVRAYLRNERSPGDRRSRRPDALEPFVPYIRARLGQNPHVPATTLHRELVERGYTQSYASLTAHLRGRALQTANNPTQDPGKEPPTGPPTTVTSDAIEVTLPADPPPLSPDAARAMLRILLRATRTTGHDGPLTKPTLR